MPTLAELGITGLDEGVVSMKRIDTAFHRKMLIMDMAKEIAEQAAALVPIDTGALRDSIRYEKVDDETADIIAGDYPGQGPVNYAAYVELGTYKMDAQPYLRPAADTVTKGNGFTGTLQLIVNKAVRG